MVRQLYRRLRRLVRTIGTLPDELRTIERAVRDGSARETKAREVERKAAARELSAIRSELETLRETTDARLRDQRLQLGRLLALAEGGQERPTLGGRVPLTVAASAFAPSGDHQPMVGEEWLTLDACPACATVGRTVVCEWNKLVLLDVIPEASAARYDYAVCHGCGILYATRRPYGTRYRYLMDHFENVIDRGASANPLLNSQPLTDADRQRYRTLLANGVFVSDHDPKPSIDGVLKDRLENAAHVELLGSLLDLRGARVLEVRSRAGTIVQGLKRLYGAEVYAMPIFESQQLILRELYGVTTSEIIDFDRFTIPFETPFDLIACNHMFTHAVRLDQFLKTLRDALRPGGHLYLYNEIADSEYLDGLQSMIATMNPLHLQACDGPSLSRAIEASGFEVMFLKERKHHHLCLARKVEPTHAWTPMSEEQRQARVARYLRARDRAILRAPEAMRSRFADTWSATVERAVTTGVAVLTEAGELKVVKA